MINEPAGSLRHAERLSFFEGSISSLRRDLGIDILPELVVGEVS
jgi:hypothetical protein